MFQSGEDPDEALQYAKLELFQDQVFCFTPKGRVIALPKGATPLDFAYGVHTDVGDQCIGAKINGVQRPLRTPLNNGDVVEILRSEHAPVPVEWESIAVMGKSRSAIRRRIKKMQHADHIALGRSIAESVFTGAHLEFSLKGVREGLKRLEKNSVEEVLLAIGKGELPVGELVEAVYPGASIEESESEIRAASLQAFRPRMEIAGLTPGVSVKMARCCTPIPGERIVGIRQDDGSVKVHTIYCETLAEEDPPQERWLDLKWRERDEGATAHTRVTATVMNGVGVLSELAGIIARYGVSIANIRIHNRSREFVDFVLDVEVKDARHLAQMLAGLRASPHVIDAERTGAEDHDEV